MRTEREKMLAGELYDPLDVELVNARSRARGLCHRLATAGDAEARRKLLIELLARGGETASIEPPFHCDYGSNIHLGEQVFFNFNCVVLDALEVRVGGHCLFGPGVQLLTSLHPTAAATRRRLEYGKPIEIGDDVWIGAGALVLAGVRIGSRSVIGAGSVVSRDIPDDVLAVGNPCRVLRGLDERNG
ncbi:MAG: sugar O-acetyltransferase [Pseudomonadota bacterium]|nr:sugar O-acetyltransferase [Pseudomonadota bacterium]